MDTAKISTITIILKILLFIWTPFKILVILIINETQISETNNLKVTIGALKFDGRIIPEANNLKVTIGRAG